MLKGKTIGIDATTLEANAAMRSIVRRDTGESYMEYLRGLAKQAGIDSTDDAAVRRMDRKRKKKTSNEEWVNPHDRDAEVTKMKNGATHLAYKAEQAVDLDTGAIVAITTQGGAVGDTTSVQETLPAAGFAVAEQIATPTAAGQYKVHEQGMGEVVTDKGYHSGASLVAMRELGVRSYVSAPQQPRRNLEGKGRAASFGVRQPAARGRRAREASAAAAGRISGASFRASVRNGRTAEGACTRPIQRCQASVVAGRCVQSRADSAFYHQGGNAQRPGRPETQVIFDFVARSECPSDALSADHQPRQCISLRKVPLVAQYCNPFVKNLASVQKWVF